MWFQTAHKLAVPLDGNPGAAASTGSLNPMISEILRQRAAWQQPQEKKEPFTMPMFATLFAEVEALIATHPIHHLDQAAAVLDWVVLGLFTGSRLGEYGQSKIPPGQPFAVCPPAAGKWAGYPLAFIAEDFTYYSVTGVAIPHSLLFVSLARPEELHLRFRYDKSRENFTVRKFRRQPDSQFCPVARSLSIQRRAQTLSIPPHYPVGVFRADATGRFVYIQGSHIAAVMRGACARAYPDANHYLRRHILRLVAHSIRVTAAVALRAAGVSIPDIAQRLRWKEATVATYLRDCWADVGKFSEAALLGAYGIGATTG
jgi:hypothetical protein